MHRLAGTPLRSGDGIPLLSSIDIGLFVVLPAHLLLTDHHELTQEHARHLRISLPSLLCLPPASQGARIAYLSEVCVR